jgi:hypothetical protein
MLLHLIDSPLDRAAVRRVVTKVDRDDIGVVPPVL